MSVAELQKLIDKLSADIIRQKELLQTLEQKRSVARRELNSVRDPMARLPLEISSEIFIQCLPARPQPGAFHVPMIFLNICNSWTDIALSIPPLWAAIHADRPLVDFASLLGAWLKRARGRALTISLPPNIADDIVAAMRPRAPQLEDLKMSHDDADLVAGVGPFFMLKTLALFGQSYSTAGVIDMLRASPNLVECILENPSLGTDVPSDVLILPQMQHFRVAQHGTPAPSSDLIFRYLSFPCLQTLALPLRHIDTQHLLQFVKRSSPPLQQLVLGSFRALGDWNLDEMEECLSLLPTLAHLELFNPKARVVTHFITILAHQPHLFPNLSSFTFHSADTSSLWYQKLVNALIARREQINVVRITWRYDGTPPPDDIWVAVRQLVVEGMVIHIGPPEQSYL